MNSKEETQYPFCPQCKGYPIIQIQKENTNKINIICHCGFKSQMLINDYLQLISTIHSFPIYNCPTHHQSFLFYCKQCHIHLCKECNKDIHNTHKLVDLIKDIPSLDTIKEKLIEAHKHLDQYFPSLRDKGKTIKKHEKEVDIAYEKGYKRNKAILALVSLFINSYSSTNYNYYLFCNIKNVNTIRIYEYTKKAIHDGIVHFFNNYCILYLKYLYVRKWHFLSYDTANHLILKNGQYVYTNGEDLNFCSITNDSISENGFSIEKPNAKLKSLQELKNGNLLIATEKVIKIVKYKENNLELLFTITPISKNRLKQGEKLKGAIVIGDKYFASYSSKHIKLFSSKEPYEDKVVKVFVEENEDIVKVIYNESNDMLIYGSVKNLTLVFISLQTGQCVLRMEFGKGFLNTMYCFDNDRLVIGNDERMYVYNIRKGKKEKEIHFKNDLVTYFEKINDDYMICVRNQSNHNKNLLVFNMNSYESYVVTKFVNCPIKAIVKASDNKLYAIAKDESKGDKIYEIEYFYNLL